MGLQLDNWGCDSLIGGRTLLKYLPEGPEGLPEGPEGLSVGPQGLPERSEGLPEGPKCLTEGLEHGCTRQDVRDVS